MASSVANEERGPNARRAILDYLALTQNQGATVTELSTYAGLAASTTHHHIKKLAEAGLIIHRPNRHKVYLSSGAQTVEQALRRLESAVGVFDEALRWADAGEGIAHVKAAAETLRMILKESEKDGQTSNSPRSS